MAKEMWVFAEKPALQAELLACAKTLGDAAAAVVLGNQAAVDQAFAQGADKVFWLGEKPDHLLLDDYVPTLAALLKEQKPAGMLVGATRRGKAIAGRLGAALGVTVLADVKKFIAEGDSLQVSHMVFGGAAVRLEKAVTDIMLATVSFGIVEALPPDPSRKGEVVKVAFVEPKWKAVLRERKPRPPSSVNLAAAKKVVCPGRGIAKKEDLEMIFELARLLEAEVGATRPLTEGLDWLPRERYIGVSGAFVKPDLYLGVGVSGQAQHTVGITESRVIVAINKDGEAPLFSQSDYGIVGDLYQIVPALINALKARK
ncbi:MAG: electron transfer flavoprotein subunit alpha/FixB family protein [Anaerolineae bacterium]|nr:electron transfer flavoprotein subunit alpha/FixB family protein [Anaerolineae bacterium]